MKTKLLAVNSATLLAVSALCLFGQGTGPLLPPAPPADGVYRTLGEIYERADAAADTRTAITTAPFTIDAPGSYYLTANLAVATGDAVTITADNVQLNLNGFTISSTANPPSGSAILLDGDRSAIAISNGHIKGNGTVSAGIFSGMGFRHGIRRALGTFSHNLRVEGLTVAGCSDAGIDLGLTTTLARDCLVENIGGAGGNWALEAATVVDCQADRVGGRGISSLIATRCHVQSRTMGLSALLTATECRGESQTDVGLAAANAHNCVGSSDSGTGLQATNALNCRGNSDSGIGLDADNATNCTGQTFTGTAAMTIEGTATSCRAWNVGGGTSLTAAIAVSCTTQGGPIVSPQKHLGTP